MKPFPHNPAHPIGTCAKCGEEMVYNVPRLGPDGGFIHKSSASFECIAPAPSPIILDYPAWTDTLPTVEGFYWMRCNGGTPVICWVRPSTDGIYLCGIMGENSATGEFITEQGTQFWSQRLSEPPTS